MITPRKAVVLGLGLGLLGALGQIWLIRLNPPQSAACRGILSIAIAVVIGAVAGRAGKTDAPKFAGLAGFFAGVVLSLVGLSVLVTSLAMGGPQLFASVESTLLFVSTILAGSVISSWIVASLALIVAFPFSFVPSRKGSESSAASIGKR